MTPRENLRRDLLAKWHEGLNLGQLVDAAFEAGAATVQTSDDLRSQLDSSRAALGRLAKEVAGRQRHAARLGRMLGDARSERDLAIRRRELSLASEELWRLYAGRQKERADKAEADVARLMALVNAKIQNVRDERIAELEGKSVKQGEALEAVRGYFRWPVSELLHRAVAAIRPFVTGEIWPDQYLWDDRVSFLEAALRTVRDELRAPAKIEPWGSAVERALVLIGAAIGAHGEPKDLPDLDLLRKFANGEGGRRTGDLIRRGWIIVCVTESGHAALSLEEAGQEIR